MSGANTASLKASFGEISKVLFSSVVHLTFVGLNDQNLTNRLFLEGIR